MEWVRRLLVGLGKGLVAVFRWAFESPVAGVVVGGLGTLYGLVVNDPSIYWPSMAILATGIIGFVTPTVSGAIGKAAGTALDVTLETVWSVYGL